MGIGRKPVWPEERSFSGSLMIPLVLQPLISPITQENKPDIRILHEGSEAQH